MCFVVVWSIRLIPLKLVETIWFSGILAPAKQNVNPSPGGGVNLEISGFKGFCPKFSGIKQSDNFELQI